MPMTEAHGQLLTGHDGIYKTKERLIQCFYWPGMDADIAAHLKSCHRCQLRHCDDRPPPTLLSPLPLPTEPGQQVHADLFGPLKTSDKGKKVHPMHHRCIYQVCRIGCVAKQRSCHSGRSHIRQMDLSLWYPYRPGDRPRDRILRQII